ncbi:MAG: AlbA family DNA-binding domain-containing protein, partial [Thermoanaerobaculia bacterium]
MIPGRIEGISLADIQRLLDNQVPEGRAIEYKKELPGSSDSERKEYLADVSSLANAGGGNLLFGLAARGGIPVALSAIQTDDPEAVVARLESGAADGIDPRITGLSTKYLPCGAGFVFVMFVPQTWNGPHMVTFKGSSRFFSRTSFGKYPLDVRQIGEAFVAREELPQRMRALRASRVDSIVRDALGFRLVPG